MSDRPRPSSIAGRGNNIVTLAENERRGGDVLQAALACVLFTSTSQERGQVTGAAQHLLDSGASMRRKEVRPVEIEEGGRPKYVEHGQHLTQATLVDELLIGELP
ncbi:hypothetical protein ACFYPZ_34115 [Streptomyces sp. NPDC005506]|uniref:hypothetical protein n=1 Tax=unclassified Streptomyces TaxID=2593676 RepID=UPI0036A001F2